jgi:hypothetical protein
MRVSGFQRRNEVITCEEEKNKNVNIRFDARSNVRGDGRKKRRLGGEFIANIIFRGISLDLKIAGDDLWRKVKSWRFDDVEVLENYEILGGLTS